MFRWYSGNKKTAEVFLHQDTGLIKIKHIRNAQRTYSERDRVFIPQDKLKAIKASAINKLIIKISKRYGEAKPLVGLKETKTEGDFKLMYLVKLKGNFINGNLHATNLSFSILADGTDIWAIRASVVNRTIWEDDK